MRALSASVPEFATMRVVSRTTGLFFLWGGLAGGLIGLSFEAAPHTRTIVERVAVLAVVTGLVVLRWGRILPRWAIHPLVLCGTGLISFVAAIAPDPASSMALSSLYVLVAIDAFFFFGARAAIAHAAVVVLALAITLGGHVGIPTVVWASLGCLWLAVGLLVGSVVRAASGAVVDSLTGLINRRGWDDALPGALEDSVRHREPLSVALVDVDHFKSVNDDRGHAAGDELLRALARDWSAVVPERAVLARRGGDEFALLLPGLSAPEAVVVVERMRAASTYQSVSCGVAEHVVGETGGDLLRRADVALYSAKASGRGRSVASDDEHDDLVRDLSAALEDGELTVAFQPVLALPGQDVVGVEALARWNHPQRGAVPPTEFIAAAETYGLIGRLGAAVLRDACRGVQFLERAWDRQLLLAVNVSGRELVEPGYPARLLAVLAETGWSPGRLVVEVTESLLEATTTTALEALAALRRSGVRVAIDDFGTGYSAFSRLDTLPADYLKLDHSFIRPIVTSPRRVAMLRALIDLSRDLGLEVIAEGVETREHAELLAAIGCPLVQGYLYGRPAAAELLGLPAPRAPQEQAQEQVSEARIGDVAGA